MELKNNDHDIKGLELYNYNFKIPSNRILTLQYKN